eukprot:CAMPEP_0119108366 /NCGR_PEP_ID=MMETSP1180-20130426/13964_1 /TAXON_ID=3052 ORGANISM="Chlamydomonas cf sp, Strain CCMP681" /NCGR_SAMPLE_ID=MMETSP1180 /ASSEMBLY_ACC=CAM_ASM_000741 /LENGTH=246 /DNA_ID=CAMNT_0007093969 /DNA_START=133 /DNA_END=873 /DNA_ORIENTATION=-
MTSALPVTSPVASVCPINFGALKGVLFDIDGTLGDSDPLHFQAFQDTLSELGFNNGKPITEEWFLENISGRHNATINLELFPGQEQAANEWCDAREARFRSLAEVSLQPIHGLGQFTSWVEARGLRRGAVTNAPRLNAEMMIQSVSTTLGLNKMFFEAVVIGDECTHAKPHPEPYLEGLRQIGLSDCPQAVLCLEDSPAGVRSAIAAGLPVVGLLTGQPREALERAGATLICKDFAELVSIIKLQM